LKAIEKILKALDDILKALDESARRKRQTKALDRNTGQEYLTGVQDRPIRPNYKTKRWNPNAARTVQRG